MESCHPKDSNLAFEEFISLQRAASAISYAETPINKLRMFNPDFLETTVAYYKEELGELESMQPSKMTLENQLDYHYWKNKIEKSLWELEVAKSHEWEVTRYNVLSLFDILPPEVQYELLPQIPIYYETAKNIIQHPTKEQCIQAVRDHFKTYDYLSDSLVADVSWTDLEIAAFTESKEAAILAVKDFIAYLNSWLYNAVDTSATEYLRKDAVGSQQFEERLNFVFGIPQNLEEWAAKILGQPTLADISLYNKKVLEAPDFANNFLSNLPKEQTIADYTPLAVQLEADSTTGDTTRNLLHTLAELDYELHVLNVKEDSCMAKLMKQTNMTKEEAKYWIDAIYIHPCYYFGEYATLLTLDELKSRASQQGIKKTTYLSAIKNYSYLPTAFFKEIFDL